MALGAASADSTEAIFKQSHCRKWQADMEPRVMMSRPPVARRSLVEHASTSWRDQTILDRPARYQRVTSGATINAAATH